MNTRIILAATLLAAAATPAAADNTLGVSNSAAMQKAETGAVALKVGQTVFAANGTRLGKVHSLVGDKAAPTAIRVIFASRLVTIPAATLSAGDKASRIVTSMASTELN